MIDLGIPRPGDDHLRTARQAWVEELEGDRHVGAQPVTQAQ
jgi:hypothetical protein